VPTEVRFSTLPPFTESSLLPTDGSAHAFFDLVANQIVIVPAAVAAGETPEVLRYDLPNRTSPTLSWLVVALDGGSYS